MFSRDMEKLSNLPEVFVETTSLVNLIIRTVSMEIGPFLYAPLFSYVYISEI